MRGRAGRVPKTCQQQSDDNSDDEGNHACTALLF